MQIKLNAFNTITLKTAANTLNTIGHDQLFNPVLYFTPEERDQAFHDLVAYFNEFPTCWPLVWI